MNVKTAQKSMKVPFLSEFEEAGALGSLAAMAWDREGGEVH